MSDLTVRMYERETEAGTVLSVDVSMADGRMAGVDALGGFDMPPQDWEAVVGKVIDAAVALNV